MRSRFGLRLNRGLRLRPSFALLPGSIVTVGGVAGIRPGDGTGEGKGRSAGGTGKGTFFLRIFARPPMFRPVWRSREDSITISRARERGRRDRADAHHPGLFFAIARCSHRRAVSARSGEIPTGYNGKAHTDWLDFKMNNIPDWAAKAGLSARRRAFLLRRGRQRLLLLPLLLGAPAPLRIRRPRAHRRPNLGRRSASSLRRRPNLSRRRRLRRNRRRPPPGLVYTPVPVVRRPFA